jgi:hypothetical protein
VCEAASQAAKKSIAPVEISAGDRCLSLVRLGCRATRSRSSPGLSGVPHQADQVCAPALVVSLVTKVDIHQFAEFFETLEQACVRSAATEMWTLVVQATSDILSVRPDADPSRHNNAEG